MQGNSLSHAESKRPLIAENLSREARGVNGQYMTPAPVARFMAELFFATNPSDVRLLDPGAGAGALLSAFLDRWCGRHGGVDRIAVTAFEIDPYLLTELIDTIKYCEHNCRQTGTEVSFEVIAGDFVLAGSELLAPDLFSRPSTPRTFTHAILNPPYRKIRSDSQHRRALRRAGIETSNLYAAFVAVAVKLLAPGGQMVAIVPRSFCNGPYFQPFRELLLRESRLKRVHVFQSRQRAFRDDNVLQENVIIHVVKCAQALPVAISSSSGPTFNDLRIREVPPERVVNSSDARLVIHLPTDDIDDYVLERVAALPCTLKDLGVEVSTGPVVEFRLRDFIQDDPEPGAVPLIHPAHFRNAQVVWPLRGHRRPNAILSHPASAKWLMPNGYYALTRRFSSKEEKRRIVAALHDPTGVQSDLIGFENHLNVFHVDRSGLDAELAKGLVAYLNSTLPDLYLRQFSGHTQVNASDLRDLPYPDRDTLRQLARIGDEPVGHVGREVDEFIELTLRACRSISSPDPIPIINKIEEAKRFLGHLRVPRSLQDEMSAQYLLALLNLKPSSKWDDAAAPFLTRAGILGFIHDNYGRAYVLPPCSAGGVSRLEVLERFGIGRTATGGWRTPDRTAVVQLSPAVVAAAKTFNAAENG